MIHFDLPKEQSSIIKVIGVGGGGSNAVNHMFSQNIEGVNFIICNTDAQSLTQSKVPNKIQLGPAFDAGPRCRRQPGHRQAGDGRKPGRN
jgi:cell division protein FtsZ